LHYNIAHLHRTQKLTFLTMISREMCSTSLAMYEVQFNIRAMLIDCLTKYASSRDVLDTVTV